MAKKRTVRKTAKKRVRALVSRKNVAGARSAPKRSTKAKRRKKSITRKTTDKALRKIMIPGGMD